MRAILDGRFDDAERESSRALLLGERADDPHARMFWWVQRYWLVLERGGPRDELTQLVGVYEELADQYRQVPAWLAKLALLHVRLGDHDRARDLAADLAADRFARLPTDAVWLAGLCYLAEVAVALRDRDQAGALYGLLRPHQDRLVVVDRALLCLGSVQLPLGVLASALGDTAAATRHLHVALALHQGIGAGPLVRRTRAALAT
jgi:hypothetical protein